MAHCVYFLSSIASAWLWGWSTVLQIGDQWWRRGSRWWACGDHFFLPGSYRMHSAPGATSSWLAPLSLMLRRVVLEVEARWMAKNQPPLLTSRPLPQVLGVECKATCKLCTCSALTLHFCASCFFTCQMGKGNIYPSELLQMLNVLLNLMGTCHEVSAV